ncbi:MAG: DNA photolyase family protein [Burkholderiales bacterium]|nr:DNA photolyase family protein [Burkholderiales bacterium]
MTRTIVWFRDNLRVHDNPSLFFSANSGEILPIYINDVSTPPEFMLGAASKVWLYHALNDLNESLNGNLKIFTGNPIDILNDLINTYKITAVAWNRCYDKYQITRDTEIRNMLQEKGIKTNSFNGHLLWEPWEVLKSDKTPYKVFTPYYRKGCLQVVSPRKPLERPQKITYINNKIVTSIKSLNLLPKTRWDINIVTNWNISEEGSKALLNNFLLENIYHYKIGRDFPGVKLTSRLSPYLHFGQISPHLIWDQMRSLRQENNVDCFMSELGWREFSYYLLFHFPNLYNINWQNKFDKFPWQFNSKYLEAWQKGLTGFPIIDAGMRELWQTGYMHNRVRMIVASFLTKNLLIDWRYGASWFLDTLFDADIANNSASWQLVAGCGADAQPYFRIFSPIIQSEKFDMEGIYIKQYIPELQQLPNKYIHTPWIAPHDIVSQANISLGNNYPNPIIDLTNSRKLALDLYKRL